MKWFYWLGGFACAAPIFYQIGYGRGMDWVWKNIVQNSGRDGEADAKG